MERILFERPREKLQAKGAAYLSTVELLQVIIGSGNARASAARLAKRIAHQLERGKLSVASLLLIDGMGVARACQIVAAIELGERATRHMPRSIVSPKRMQRDASRFKHKTLTIYFIDGARQELLAKSYTLGSTVSLQSLVREVCSDAIQCDARSTVISIGCKHAILTANIDDLKLTKAIKEALDTLRVAITSLYLANESAVELWKGE